MEELIKKFSERYNEVPEYYIDAGGRFELLGNHVDHNHGLCLVANCSLRIKAIVKKRNDLEVRITSEGYSPFKFNYKRMCKTYRFQPSTLSLVFGVMKRLNELGYNVGGFDAYITSEIPNGSGVSSSAAIESLIGYLISYLFNDGKIDPLTIAKVGKYAENVYFLKPCGLLDQIGTSFPNANFIDFKNINKPIIENIKFNLPLNLYLISSSGDHANLTPLYAFIPDTMRKIASLLDNKDYLRDCNDENIFSRIDSLDIEEKEKNIGKHFFIENNNVLIAKKAIENNDTELFLECVRKSQESSKNNLENTYVKGDSYLDSPQDIIDKVSSYIGDKGAIRIHGGGFKGTVLVFIKKEFNSEFLSYLEANYKNRFYKVSISESACNFKKL